ncbi:MAG TPA: DUF1634 domain-containing protein, partial [Thermomicrobiales bacterium]|nr:DUF1634 domain-containing protein [Thermomicrobiales bacterium]
MATRPEATSETVAPPAANGAVAPVVPLRMERWISLVLRGGVLLSGAIVGLGLTLFLLMQSAPGEPSAVNDLLATEFHPTSLGAILGGAADAR